MDQEGYLFTLHLLFKQTGMIQQHTIIEVIIGRVTLNTMSATVYKELLLRNWGANVI